MTSRTPSSMRTTAERSVKVKDSPRNREAMRMVKTGLQVWLNVALNLFDLFGLVWLDDFTCMTRSSWTHPEAFAGWQSILRVSENMR